MFLAIRVAPALCDNAFVSYDDGPASSTDSEAAEYFEIFLAVYKSTGSILADGSGRAGAVNRYESALAKISCDPKRKNNTVILRSWCVFIRDEKF